MLNRNKFSSFIFLLFLVVTSAANASFKQESSIINEKLLSENNIHQEVEFETFVIRYLTYYPNAIFPDAIKLANTAIKKVYKLYKIKKIFNEINANCIENLINITNYKKTEISKITGKKIKDIDKDLLSAAIDSTNDPYTHFVKKIITPTNKNINTNKVDNFYLSPDKTYLKIKTFKSSRGCLPPSVINSIKRVNVIDIRNNTGGDLDCTFSILRNILTKGNHHITTITSNDFKRSIDLNGNQNNQKEIKKRGVILVNGYTASSAEIFASALFKDGWQLIGMPMFNKRCMQSIFKSLYGDYKMTVASFIL